jgi:hypothetical protein
LILQPNAFAQRTTLIHKEQIEHAFIYREGDTFYGAIVGATSEIVAASLTANASGMITLPLWAAKPTEIATAGRIVYVTDINAATAGIYLQTATEWIRIPGINNIGTTIASKSIVDEQLSGVVDGYNSTYQTGAEYQWDTLSISVRWSPSYEHIRLMRGVHYLQSGSDTIEMVTPFSHVDVYNGENIDTRFYASYVIP